MNTGALIVFSNRISINYLSIPQAACTEIWGVPRICQFRPPAFHFSSMLVFILKHSGSSIHELLDQDKSQITPWEATFIIFAVAFTLSEYTASIEHGWISALFSSNMLAHAQKFPYSLYHKRKVESNSDVCPCRTIYNL